MKGSVVAMSKTANTGRTNGGAVNVRNIEHGLFVFITNVVTVVLCILLVIATIVAISEFRDYNAGYKINSFEYAAQDGRFADISEYARENRASGHTRGDLDAYCALGAYYDATFAYRMYGDAGDDERTAAAAQNREAAAAELGTLSEYAPEIDALLGVE